MPRTPSAPLYQVDPEKLADEVVGAVEAQAQRLAFAIGKSLMDMGPCDLHFSVQVLAHYALHGGELDAPVNEYLLSMAPVWTRASDGACFTTPEFDDPDTVDATTWLGQLVLVMRAALGRELLAQGRPVSPAELAVLGGVSSRHVRHLLRSGDIAGQDDGVRWTIPAAEAKRWLATRQPS